MSEAPKTLRQAPADDAQLDIFVPPLLDISSKDGVEFMDVALYRLSKNKTQQGGKITHTLPSCTIEIKGGADGMATIYDYDLVIMMISALAYATDQWRKGHGDKPSRYFEPHAREVLKFCRRPDNGQAYTRLSEALDRLHGTTFTVTSTDGDKRRDGRYPLLGGSEVTSHTETGKIGRVLITIPEWIYKNVTEYEHPQVLTIHPDFFLIKSGVGRFVYRYTRKAAGRDWAKVGLAKLHERAGGQSELKEFRRAIRALVTEDGLPEYTLTLEGDCLYMAKRDWLMTQTVPEGMTWPQAIEQAKDVRRLVKGVTKQRRFSGL